MNALRNCEAADRLRAAIRGMVCGAGRPQPWEEGVTLGKSRAGALMRMTRRGLIGREYNRLRRRFAKPFQRRSNDVFRFRDRRSIIRAERAVIRRPERIVMPTRSSATAR